jgi:IS5 family transposase
VQAKLDGLKRELHTFVERTGQVIQQTKARVFDNNTHAEEKLVSIFKPESEIIRKGKAGKPTEFGKMVKIQEAENQIITAYEVYEQRPNDKDLLVKPASRVKPRSSARSMAW